MKQDVIRFIGILLLIIAFSILVYPTPYEYVSYKEVPIKINRITGKTHVLFIESGWREIENKN